MEKKDKSFVLEWRVVSLAQGNKLPKEIIPIESLKFKDVRKTLGPKGYRCLQGQMYGACFTQPSIRGLVIAINEEHHSIRASAPSFTALSQIINDFNLPMYRSA